MAGTTNTSSVKRMSAREGRGFVNGNRVTSLIKLNAVFTPEITDKRVAGQRGTSAKVIGYAITGTITQFKATRWLRDAIKTYMTTGVFPQMDIQAVMDDADSDFFSTYGEERIQLIGVQLTGDLPVIDIDAEGEEIQEEVTFSAAEIRFL